MNCIIILAAALPVFDFATNSIAERISAFDPAVSLSRFADYPPSKGKLGFPRSLWEKPFPANDRFWLKGIDFSCASPWNDENGSTRAGTLISRRHIAFAKHFPLWKGCRVLFVDQAGEVCPCRVKATKSVGKTDIMIGLLDYEVTPNIHPAKILPENFADYIGDGRGLPIVTFNQNEKAYLSECRSINEFAVVNNVSTNAAWKLFGGNLVGGDSGNPAFLLIGDQPILLYCLYMGGVGHGSSFFHFRKEIQKTMDELCPGYKLESFDFSTQRWQTTMEKRNPFRFREKRAPRAIDCRPAHRGSGVSPVCHSASFPVVALGATSCASLTSGKDSASPLRFAHSRVAQATCVP